MIFSPFLGSAIGSFFSGPNPYPLKSQLPTPTCLYRRLQGEETLTWTPKVCRIMAFWAIFRGFRPLFYLLWGFGKPSIQPWDLNYKPPAELMNQQAAAGHHGSGCRINPLSSPPIQKQRHANYGKAATSSCRNRLDPNRGM